MKIVQFVKKVNDIEKDVQWDKIEQKQYQGKLADQFVQCFAEVYGKKCVERRDCEEDGGSAYIPALLKAANGKIYLALLGICVRDSGEHYSTTIFLKKGAIEQADFKNRLTKAAINSIFPYKYKPLVEIVGDIHQDQYF